MTIDEIESRALQLSPEEIGELIDRLIVHRELAHEIEQSWAEEAERRIAEFDRGEVEGIPMEVTLAKMRAMLHDDVDPADLEEARRRLDDMKSGRVKGIPAEELLDKLDRMAE